VIVDCVQVSERVRVCVCVCVCVFVDVIMTIDSFLSSIRIRINYWVAVVMWMDQFRQLENQ
jgi:hypothetical protein